MLIYHSNKKAILMMRARYLNKLCVLALLFAVAISMSAEQVDPVARARKNAHSKLPDWIELTKTTITSSISRGKTQTEMYGKYGISDLSELNGAVLGEPYPYYRLTCEDVLAYQPGDDLLSQLEIILYEFPILVNGKVCGVACATPEKTTGFAMGSPVIVIREQYRDTHSKEEGYQYAQLNLHNKFFFVIRSGPEGLYITGAVERDLGLLFGAEYASGTYPFMSLDEAMPKLKEVAEYFMKSQ